ncbi:MAG TPA: hypothetical protein VF281_02790 [Candidatus Saccharimonadales bacterium]
MNRFLILTCLAITLVGSVALSGVVRAEDQAPMTEAHIARIRANCVDTKGSLQQLQATDAGLRVNRGQIYESIATKLMAPLNSRLVLNRIDSETFLNIADEYEQQLHTFRQLYQQYDEAMSATLRINCINQPVAFYDSVADTRAKRQQTHEATVQLHKIIEKYGIEVDNFARNFAADKS